MQVKKVIAIFHDHHLQFAQEQKNWNQVERLGIVFHDHFPFFSNVLVMIIKVNHRGFLIIKQVEIQT